MADYTEDDLFDMSDEDFEAAFKEAKASEQSPDTEIEEDISTEGVNPQDEETAEVDDNTEDDAEVELDDVEDDGSEQPEQDTDSDHNGDETEEDEVDEEDQSETDDEALDEDSVAEDDKGSEETKSTDEETQPAQPYKFKANGKEYEFSGEEIVEQFPKIFGQAMDYTKKMQAIKPWRKTIDALEGAELAHEDVSLMIDVLKGDKGAINEIIKRTGVDTLDLKDDEDKPYVANDYGRDDRALAIKDVVDSISQDDEYSTTHGILSNEWDDQSWQTMSENPEMIKLLHLDVKSGMYQQLQPIAEKMKVFAGGSKTDLECYKEAAQQFYANKSKADIATKQQEKREAERADQDAETARLQDVKAKAKKRSATKKASVKRKAAAPTKNTGTQKGVVDYLDTNEEEFDDWYKKLQDSV